METINPRGVAKFDPRDMNGTIYVKNFQRRRFFLVFPIVSLWRLSTPRATKYQSCGHCGLREEDF